jgi:hypothetical protein
MNVPAPPGPVALYVCHESRAFALKRYQLALGGTNCQPDDDTEFAEVWQKGSYCEKKIWVNFEIDTIFLALSAFDQEVSFIHGPFSNALTLLTLYAKEEAKKIKRLAISENWTNRRTIGSPPESWTAHLPQEGNPHLSY